MFSETTAELINYMVLRVICYDEGPTLAKGVVPRAPRIQGTALIVIVSLNLYITI